MREKRACKLKIVAEIYEVTFHYLCIKSGEQVSGRVWSSFIVA
jgi:hypothetical protein